MNPYRNQKIKPEDEQYVYRVVSEDGTVLEDLILFPHATKMSMCGWWWQEPKSILYDVVRVEGKTVVVRPHDV